MAQWAFLRPSFFSLDPAEHPFVRAANTVRRRPERRSRTREDRAPSGLVLDGRSHGGTIAAAGEEERD